MHELPTRLYRPWRAVAGLTNGPPGFEDGASVYLSWDTFADVQLGQGLRRGVVAAQVESEQLVR